MRPQNQRPPPRDDADDGLEVENEPSGKTLVGKPSNDNAGPQDHGAAPSAVDAAVEARRLGFELVGEIAALAISAAKDLDDAAARCDLARARLHACRLSRIVRSALVEVGDILESRRAA